MITQDEFEVIFEYYNKSEFYRTTIYQNDIYVLTGYPITYNATFQRSMLSCRFKPFVIQNDENYDDKNNTLFVEEQYFWLKINEKSYSLMQEMIQLLLTNKQSNIDKAYLKFQEIINNNGN